MADKVLKDNRLVVTSLKNALEVTEGAHEELQTRFKNGQHSVDGTSVVAAGLAASNLRRALRALGVDIPVRKGPKPKALATKS